MRILLTFEYPFDAKSYGGGQQIARGLARAFVRAGHEVHVVANGFDALGVARADRGVQYHFSGGFHRVAGGFQLARAALPLIRSLRPDLVCSFTSEAPLVVPFARATGARTVVYLAAPALPPFRKLNLDWPRAVRRNVGPFLQFLGCAPARRVVAISDYLARMAVEQWGISPNRIVAVGAGLDEAILACPPKMPPPMPPSGPRLLSIGRVSFAQKPLDSVARALAGMRSSWSSWTIVGSGEDDANLASLVGSLGLTDRVMLAGTKTSSEIRQHLDESHIAVLPSSHESFFITAYEAVACGRPVIANRVADLARDFAAVPSVVMAGGTEPAHYAAALQHAITNLEHLSATARTTAEHTRLTHTWDAVAGAILRAA